MGAEPNLEGYKSIVLNSKPWMLLACCMMQLHIIFKAALGRTNFNDNAAH